MFGWAGGHVWLPCGWFYRQLVCSLGTAVVAALWGTKRRSRCREIVLALFVKGHFVDPLWNASDQSLRQLRRMAEQRPEAFAELERVWRCYANVGEMCDGPGTAYCKGWVGTAKRPRLRLLDGPESWWLHEIRQGLRLAEQRKAGNRRNDMRGIESTAGIDKLAAAKAKNSTKIPPEQRHDLRELLCGCVWTQRGNLTAKEQSPLCVCFVVENLKMKSTFSGGVQSGRRFAVRSKSQSTGIARRGRRAPRVSFWRTLSQSLGQTWGRHMSAFDQLQYLASMYSFG